MYPQVIDIKCISHASCNVGLQLFDSCKFASKFIGKFNNMLNSSPFARSRFHELILTQVKRYTSDIRWFYQQESATQIHDFWKEVVMLINDPDSFATGIRTKLKSLVNDHENDIRLELSLLKDVGIPLAKLCY